MDFIVSFDGVGPSSGVTLALWIFAGVAMIALGLGFFSWLPTERFMSDRTSTVTGGVLFVVGTLVAAVVTTLYVIDVFKFRSGIENALDTTIDATTLGLPARDTETKMVLTTGKGYADCVTSRLDDSGDTLTRVQFSCTFRN